MHNKFSKKGVYSMKYGLKWELKQSTVSPHYSVLIEDHDCFGHIDIGHPKNNTAETFTCFKIMVINFPWGGVVVHPPLMHAQLIVCIYVKSTRASLGLIASSSTWCYIIVTYSKPYWHTSIQAWNSDWKVYSNVQIWWDSLWRRLIMWTFIFKIITFYE